MIALTAVLGLASLVGCAGLYRATPRPRAQEAWAIVALAPVFLLVAIALIGATHV